MKKFALTTLIALVGAVGPVALVAMGSLALASAAADARPYHRSGARVGIYVGTGILAAPWVYGRPYYYGPYAYPYYPYPYPTDYPRVVVQEQPMVYVESQAPVAVAPTGPQQAPQAQQPYWYFCQSSQTYYPHVQSCATPWQRVIPHAPQ